MSADNRTPAPKPSIDELRADIRQTRAELGETVQALAAKADVKARAREQVEQTRQRVLSQAAEATGRVREAAALAGGRVRGAAVQTADRVRDGELPVPAAKARDGIRQAPVPPALLIAGVAAIVGIILIMRGRRR